MADPIQELEVLLLGHASNGAIKSLTVEFSNGSSIEGFATRISASFSGPFELEVTPFVARSREEGPRTIQWSEVRRVVVELRSGEWREFTILS